MKVLAFALLILTGCWATPDRRPDAVRSAVKPGMTMAQVIEIGGEPDGMTVGGGRVVTWGYGSTLVHWGPDGRVESVSSQP